jgi:DNA-binding NarL/FixJ family response regulator
VAKTRVVDSKLKMLFDQMPGAWGCKDENSVFMYANDEYCQAIGLKHKEEAIGLTDFDMPCETVNCAHLFRQQDEAVIRTAQKMRILDIHPFSGYEWRAYIFTKTPLRDGNQEVIGTIFHGADITNSSSIELGSLLSQISVEGVKNDLLGQNSYMLGTKFRNLKLSDRQSEVLFYLLRGKTVKKIAYLLRISPRTVDEYLEQLKHKFNAQNRHELIDKTMSLGYLNIIPERLFNQQLSIALRD